MAISTLKHQRRYENMVLLWIALFLLFVASLRFGMIWVHMRAGKVRTDQA